MLAHGVVQYYVGIFLWRGNGTLHGSVCVHVSGSEIIVVGLVSGEDILADLNELYEGECGVPCKCVS